MYSQSNPRQALPRRPRHRLQVRHHMLSHGCGLHMQGTVKAHQPQSIASKRAKFRRQPPRTRGAKLRKPGLESKQRQRHVALQMKPRPSNERSRQRQQEKRQTAKQRQRLSARRSRLQRHRRGVKLRKPRLGSENKRKQPRRRLGEKPRRLKLDNGPRGRSAQSHRPNSAQSSPERPRRRRLLAVPAVVDPLSLRAMPLAACCKAS
mmetsp:Transcript_45130/g.107321  ORF Transcript_45130/g.107321 Transcript_45130/m.107321 type:complete len:206 (+) Transcript_45130:7385-8002(+)